MSASAKRGDAPAIGMAAIGGAVAAGSAISPRLFLKIFGIDESEVTGAARFGWRLFAVRTAYISALALRGDSAARAAFLPVQLLDQAVFWHAFSERSVPRRASVMAAAASGVIIVLDLRRRGGARLSATAVDGVEGAAGSVRGK